jgi:hypothetical protein
MLAATGSMSMAARSFRCASRAALSATRSLYGTTIVSSAAPGVTPGVPGMPRVANPERAAGETNGGHPGLGSRRDEADLVDVGYERHDEAGKLYFELARGSERGSATRGVAHRVDDRGMGMAEQQRAPRLDEVDEGIAVDVGDLGAARTPDEERIGSHRIEGAHGRVHPADHDLPRLREQLVRLAA